MVITVGRWCRGEVTDGEEMASGEETTDGEERWRW